MAAPNRPVSGAPIETAWGDAVHDAAVSTMGVVVACAAYASNAVRAGFDMTSVVQGKASMADLAGDAIVIPVTGIYEVIVSAVVGGYTGGYYRLDLSVGGVSQGAAVFAFPAISNTTLRAGPSATVRKFNAGDRLAIGCIAPVGGSGTQTITVDWFGVRLVASDWAA